MKRSSPWEVSLLSWVFFKPTPILCSTWLTFVHLEQYQTNLGLVSIWESGMWGSWHSWWYREWHWTHSTSWFLALTPMPWHMTQARSSSNISTRFSSVWRMSEDASREITSGELLLLDLLEGLVEDDELLLFLLLLLPPPFPLLLWSLRTCSSTMYCNYNYDYQLVQV